MSALPIIIGLAVVLLVLAMAFRSNKRAKPGPKNNWNNAGHAGVVSSSGAPGEAAVPLSCDAGGDCGAGGGD